MLSKIYRPSIICLTFFIDITTSMSKSIKSVKDSIKKITESMKDCKQENAIFHFEFITFSESNKSTYARYVEIQGADEALNYIKTVSIGRPDEKKNLITNLDEIFKKGLSNDGPENLKLALVVFNQQRFY